MDQQEQEAKAARATAIIKGLTGLGRDALIDKLVDVSEALRGERTTTDRIAELFGENISAVANMGARLLALLGGGQTSQGLVDMRVPSLPTPCRDVPELIARRMGELARLNAQATALQTRGSELLEQNRALRHALGTKVTCAQHEREGWSDSLTGRAIVTVTYERWRLLCGVKPKPPVNAIERISRAIAEQLVELEEAIRSSDRPTLTEMPAVQEGVSP
jgi:hypothetical protein